MRRLIFGIFLGILLSGSLFAQGRYRQMNLNFAGSYGEGLAGFAPLENSYSYALWYSYWMNDTSSLDIQIAQIRSEYSYEVQKPGGREQEGSADWSSLLGTIGVRYQPAWDFFLDLGLGAGMGYEGWSIESDWFKSRNGNGPLYYLLLDAEYPFRSWLSVGLFLEPFYYPLKERLEKRVEIDKAGNKQLEYAKLENSWICLGGIWVKIRIY